MEHLHRHSSGDEHAGGLIHRADLYNKLSKPLLKKSEPSIIRLARIKPGDKVLDLCCGPGTLTLEAKRWAGPTGEVKGIDGSQEMVEVARQNAARAGLEVDFRTGLAQALPYKNEEFDVVISRLAIHHLPGEMKGKAFGEVFRVLKPGGYFLIVDFDTRTVPLPLKFLLMVGPMKGMRKVDLNTYIPLLEVPGFTGIKRGSTGHRMLAFVGGEKPGSQPGNQNF